MVNYEICPECKKKQMYFRVAFNTFICYYCKREFDKDKILLEEKNLIIDKNGNRYKTEIRKDGSKIIHSTIYFLKGNFKTLKGEHNKLNNNNCPFEDRLDCNYGIGYERCKYMIYKDGYWVCEYKNLEDNTKSDIKQELHKETIEDKDKQQVA